jgi:hypothetical protein
MKSFSLVVLCLLITVGLVLAQTPATPPNLNNPDDPPCVDPTDTAVCSQDFYWDQPSGDPLPNWYEVFRRTLPQTGNPTAWVKVGNTTELRWWTALDAGDSELNAVGEVRAGQQKPGFMYEYRVRSCRLVDQTWDIICTGFSTDSVQFQGVVYNRSVQ